MFKIINTFNNYSFKVLRNLVPSYTGMLRVKAGRPLVNHLLKMVLLVKGSIETSLVKVIICYIRFLHSLNKKNGIKYTAKFLKASVSLLMQALAGEKHVSTQVLGVAMARTNRGLPRFIPAIHRAHIRSGNLFYIRLWLSLLSIYRVLDFTGKINIKTITDPSKAVINYSELNMAVSSFIGDKLKLISQPIVPFWIASSSPCSTKQYKKIDMPINSSFSTSLPAMFKGLWAYSKDLPLAENFIKYATLSKLGGQVLSIIKYVVITKGSDIPKILSLKDRVFVNLENFSSLGKLAFKIEPAGKIRIFAMVDNWTQWLLKPLHNQLFSFLSKLSTDATFDQTKTVDTFNAMITSKGIRKVYSFDLTAATDRIPVSVQASILSMAFKQPDLGESWARVLVGRWYTLPYPEWDPTAISCKILGVDPQNPGDNIRIKELKVDGGKTIPVVDAVRYATGQPMGALSSWAMLALTHHIMVRIAATRAGLSDFKLYMVLGDDLVIADSDVAKYYLQLAKEWDIGINLSKSVLSRNGSFEFAKRFFYKGNDVSGLSFKEMAVAYWDLRALFQMAGRINRFRTFRVSEMLSFLGHGYKALSRLSAKYSQMGRSMRRALLLASYPGSLFSKFTSFEDWLGSVGFNRYFKTRWSHKVYRELQGLMVKAINAPIEFDLSKSTGETVEMLIGVYPKDLRNSLRARLTYDPYNQVVLQEGLLEWMESMLYHLYTPLYQKAVDIRERAVEHFGKSQHLDPFGLDPYFVLLDELEDINSLTSNASEYRETKDVITLGNSKLLRKADLLRATLDKFSKENKRVSVKPR